MDSDQNANVDVEANLNTSNSRSRQSHTQLDAENEKKAGGVHPPSAQPAKVTDSAPRGGERVSNYLRAQEYRERAYLGRFSRSRGRAPEPEAPIDPKTCFDVLISCGLGAKAHNMASNFHDPNFRVCFSSKIYSILLVQLLFIIVWMSLVLTSQSFEEMLVGRTGVIIVSLTIYLLINMAVRCSNCGGDGMCFMGYMVVMIFMTTSLSMAAGALVTIFPVLIFIVSGIWLSVVLLVIGNFSKQINILGSLVYPWALVSAGLSSLCMTWLFRHLQPEFTMPSAGCWILNGLLPISVSIILVTVFIVYESKKLIGGRRADFEPSQWILAALIL